MTSSIQWCVKSSTDEEGKTTYYLELQGNGEIPDYAQNDELPWEEWRDEITVCNGWIPVLLKSAVMFLRTWML